MSLDLYNILDVPRGASLEQVKQAYRRKAMVYHPDINPAPDANETFQLINKAYQVLSDPHARAAYDNWLRDAVAGIGPSQYGRPRPDRRTYGATAPMPPKEERFDIVSSIAGLVFCFVILVIGFCLLLLTFGYLTGPLHNGRLSAFYGLLLLSAAFLFVGLSGAQKVLAVLRKR